MVRKPREPQDISHLVKPIHNPESFRIPNGADGQQRRQLTRGNEAYNRVLAQNNQLCSDLAYIRWMLYQLPLQQYGERMGTSKCQVMHTEQLKHATGAPLRYKLFSRYIQQWMADRQSLDSLHENPQVPLALIQRIVDSLVGKNRGSVYGLFQELDYRIGPGKVADAVDPQRLARECLRDRRDKLVIVPYELIAQTRESFVLSDYGFDEDRLDKTWEQETRAIYTARGVPPPLATLHINDQMNQANLLGRTETILLPSEKRTAAFQLARFQMPPASEVLSIIEQLIAPDDVEAFLIDYEACATAENTQPNFMAELLKRQTERGITDSMLKSMLKTNERPSSFLNDPSIEGRDLPCETAPPAVLAYIIANNEHEAEQLIGYFRENRARYRKRMGVANAGNALRLDREQWGVGSKAIIAAFEELNSKTNQSDWGATWTDLQQCKDWQLTARIVILFENNQRRLDDKPDIAKQKLQALRNVVTHLGKRKARHALEIKKGYTEPKTVQEAVVRLTELAGARVPWEFRNLAQQCCSSIPEGLNKADINRHLLRRIAEGIEVPAWPVLRHIVTSMKATVTPELKLDWNRRYTKQLAGQIHIPPGRIAPKAHPIPKHLSNPTVHQPLSRLLHVTMEGIATSMTGFAKSGRFGASATTAATNIAECLQACNLPASDIEGNAELEDQWNNALTMIESILDGADVCASSTQWRRREFIVCLHKHKQDTEAALHEWRKRSKTKPGDAVEQETLAGLLPEEMDPKADPPPSTVVYTMLGYKRKPTKKQKRTRRR